MTDSKIKKAVKDFDWKTSFSSSTHGDPATIDDVKKLKAATIELFLTLAKETK